MTTLLLSPCGRSALRALSALALALLALTTSASGATLTFDNDSGDNSWGTASNWNPDSLPARRDFVDIGNNSTIAITSEPAVARYLRVVGGSELNIEGGSLEVARNGYGWMYVGYFGSGVINQTGGDVSVTSGSASLGVYDQGEYNLLDGNVTVGGDLGVFSGGVLQVASGTNLTIGDDFFVAGGSTLTLSLTGTGVPAINVGDDLQISAGAALNIDTSDWTGGNEITLFNVGGAVSGAFSSITVNGEVLETTEYTYTGTSLVIQSVGEPDPTILLGFGLAAAVVFRRSRPSCPQ